MIDKKDFLLQSMIRAYIEHLEPIGSSQLKSLYDITFSPATIRGYFRKLAQEGYLMQEHISSGRIPTFEALKEYWNNRIEADIGNIDLEKLKFLSSKLDLTVFIMQEKQNKLEKIFNIENRYMILEFDEFSINIKFNQALFKFLSDMVGLELNDILKIAKQVGAYELYEEMSSKVSNSLFEILNIKNYLKIAVEYDLDENLINDFLRGHILEQLGEGIYFEDLLPQGYIGICHNCKLNNEDVKILVVGELAKDYEYFYNNIKG